MKQLLAVAPVKDIPKLPHHWEGILLKVRFHTGRWDMFLSYRKWSLECVFIFCTENGRWDVFLLCRILSLFVCLMVFNATFNNISVISWWSVLLVEETGEPGENH
jgi:hypothetical protein